MLRLATFDAYCRLTLSKMKVHFFDIRDGSASEVLLIDLSSLLEKLLPAGHNGYPPQNAQMSRPMELKSLSIFGVQGIQTMESAHLGTFLQ